MGSGEAIPEGSQGEAVRLCLKLSEKSLFIFLVF